MVSSLAVQADGRILVGGYFSTLRGHPCSHIGRLNPDGTVDTDFSPSADATVSALAVQADGKIVVGGYFSTLAGEARRGIGRLSADGTLDTTFNPIVEAASAPSIASLVVQTDGKVLVVGNFTKLGGQARSAIGRLNVDGTLDTSFVPETGAYADLRALAIQGEGKTLVAGTTVTTGGQPREGIIRLNANGSLDNSYTYAAVSGVRSLAVQPDGRVLVGGSFSTLGGEPRSNLGRLEANGTVDRPFNPGANSTVVTLVLQADGKILVGGSFTSLGGQLRNRIGRLEANGIVDPTFNPQAEGEPVGNVSVGALTLQPDGKVLVGGFFQRLGGQARNGIGRLNNTEPATESLSATSTSVTWLRGGTAPEVALVVFEHTANGFDWNDLGAGLRLPGGWERTGLPVHQGGTIRGRGRVVDGDRSSWLTEAYLGAPAWIISPASRVNDAGTDARFKVLVGGTAPFSYQWRKDGRELADGANTAGATTPTLTVSGVLAADEGAYTVVVSNSAGSVTSVEATLSVNDPLITVQPVSETRSSGQSVTFRVTAIGTAPLAYQWWRNGVAIMGATDSTLTLRDVQGGDVGTYTVVVSNTHGSVPSVSATLAVNRAEEGFNPGATTSDWHAPQVLALAVQPDGKILVGGGFVKLGGQPRANLGRLKADGTLDEAFNPGTDGVVNASAVQPDGKILVGGDFRTLSGQPRNCIGRLNADGTLDTAFNPGANSPVLSFVVQPDGKILVGGQFSNLGGQTRRFLARLNADGNLDPGFADVGADGIVCSVVAQADGRILVGGQFGSLGGQPRVRIGRLHAEGTLDQGFNPGADPSFGTTVLALALQADGRILVGGRFLTLGGQARERIGRLNADGTLDELFNPGASEEVSTLAVEVDGQILVGGAFGRIADLPCGYLVRLKTDGTLDLTFNAEAGGPVSAVGLQSNGQVLVGGDFKELGGYSRNGIGRLHNTGPAAESLSAGGTVVTWLRGGTAPEVEEVLFEHTADGLNWAELGVGERVSGGWELTGTSVPEGGTVRGRGQVRGGRFSGSGWVTEAYVGAPAWITSPASRADDAETTATFSVLVGGTAPFSYRWQKNGRALEDGGNVAGAATPTLTLSNVLEVDEGAYRVLVSNSAGQVTSVEATLTVNDPVITVQPVSENREPGQSVTFSVAAAGTAPLCQWYYNGEALSGATGTTLTLSNVRVENVGAYTVVVSNPYGIVTSAVAWLTVNLATADTGFSQGPNAEVYAQAVQADGKILVGGSFTALGSVGRQRLARLNADGSLDPAFTPAASATVSALAVQADGKILAGGAFTTLGGRQRQRIGRLMKSTTGTWLAESEFNPAADADVFSLAVQADGRILVGGAFSRLAGEGRQRVGRLNPNGSLDSSFNPGANGTVFALAVQADEQVLVGGDFNYLDEAPRPALGRLDKDGNLDTGFNPGANGTVHAIALQADGKILVGGAFTTLGGAQRLRVARLDESGDLDAGFNPGANGTVYSIVVQTDGKVLLGGAFTTLGGVGRDYVGRLNGDGTVDLTFNPGADATVYGLGLQVDGKALAGGAFTMLGGQGRSRFGRLNNTGQVTESLMYDGLTMTWLRGGGGPEVSTAVFYYSADGANWSPLGAGSRIAGGWQLTGVSLSAGGTVLARGGVRGGNRNGSGWFADNQAKVQDLWREGPDLVVEGLTPPPAPMIGSTQPLLWTISNRGNQSAEGSWVDRVYLSLDPVAGEDRLLGESPATGTLAINAPLERTQTVALPPDLETDREYWWIVTTDATDALKERHEGNNTFVAGPVQFLRAPAPNLQVASVEVPPNLSSGQPVTVTWTVLNAGSWFAGDGPWHDAVYLSGDEVLDAADSMLGWASAPQPLGPQETYANSLSVTLPPGLSGVWHFLVTADVDSRIGEDLFEHDNTTASTPVTVSLAPPPDLQVSGVQAPATGSSGEAVLVKWTVKNDGAGETVPASWVDQVYLSSTPDSGAGAILLGTVPHEGALVAGASYPATTTVGLPPSLSGPFYLVVRTDAGNQVFEHTQEQNNVAVTLIQIALTPPPDLIVTEFAAPATALASHSLSFRWTVANRGPTDTLEWFWEDRLYLAVDPHTVVLSPQGGEGLIYLGSFWHLGGLLAGDDYVDASAVTLPDGLSGRWYGIIETDAAAAVFELDEANNRAPTGPIQIESRPADLILTSLSANAAAQAGSSLVVSWSVRNQGAGDTAVSRWTDRLLLSADTTPGNADDVTLLSRERDGLLNPGATYSANDQVVGIPFSIAPGNWWLFAVADADNAVYEGTQEHNNASTPRPLAITRTTADLIMASVSLAPLGGTGEEEGPIIAFSEDSITVDWTVENRGEAAPNSDLWTDAVYLSASGTVDENALLLGNARNPLAPGPDEAYTSRLAVQLPAEVQGEFSVVVHTDAAAEVIEDNRANNARAASKRLHISLRPVPDLEVVTVRGPGEAYGGQPADFFWTVRNGGPADAPGEWFDSVYLSLDPVFNAESDIYIGYAGRPRGLGPGEAYEQTASLTIPRGLAGWLHLFVVCDATGRIHERGGKANNTARAADPVKVWMRPPTDLVAGIVEIPPHAWAGDNMAITYTLHNGGENDAFGPWLDSLYLSADKQWDLSDALFAHLSQTEVLGARSTRSQTVTAPVPGVFPGQYYLIIRSDVLIQVPDTDRSNNLSASLGSVTTGVRELPFDQAVPVDLVAGGAVYYRFSAIQGQTIRLRFTATRQVAAELLVGFERVPSRAEFDFGTHRPFVETLELTVPVQANGNYYLRVQGVYGSSRCTLRAEFLPLTISEVTPGVVGNNGMATLLVKGALFTPTTVFALREAEGKDLPAHRTQVWDSTLAYVTFDCVGLSPGAYGLAAETTGPGGSQAFLPDALTVISSRGARVIADVVGDPFLRAGRTSPLTLIYENVGDQDTPAPLILVLHSRDMPMGFSATALSAETVQVLGLGSEGRLDLLRVGVEQAEGLWIAVPPHGGQLGLRTRVVLTNDKTALMDWDWVEIEKSVRPFAVDHGTWREFWDNNIRPRVGRTFGDYVRFLNRLAVTLEVNGLASRDIRAMFAALLVWDPTYRAASSMAGVLLNAADESPIVGLELAAYRVLDHGYELAGTATTRGNGRFDIHYLEPGSYRLALGDYGVDMDRNGEQDYQPPVWEITPYADLSQVTLYLLSQQGETPDVLNDANPVAALDSAGTPHLVWNRGGAVWHAWFNGSEWVDAQAVSEAPAGNLALAVAPNLIDGQDPGLIAVWEQGSGNESELFYAVGRPQSETGFEWSQPVQLTDDGVADAGPAVKVNQSGQALIVFLKKDAAIQDDFDLYYALVEMASGSMQWPSRGPAVGLAGVRAEFDKEWPSEGRFHAFGLGFKASIAGLVAGEVEDCEAKLEGGTSGGLSFRLPGMGGLDFVGGGSASFTWKANRQACEWQFSGGQIDAEVSATFIWKDGLVKVLYGCQAPGIAAATSYRIAAKALTRCTGGRLQLENGVNFGFEASFKELRWNHAAPFPKWVYPSYIGGLDVSAFGGPYAALTLEGIYDVELKLSGACQATFGVLPDFRWKGFSFSVTLDASIGAFVFYRTWKWPASGAALASPPPTPGLPEGLEMRYDPTAAIGSASVYGANSVRADVWDDLYRDSPPLLLQHGNSNIRAIWSREEDPYAGNDSRLYAAAFDGHWAPPAQIPGTGGMHRALAAVVDGRDRLLAVWSAADGSGLGDETTFQELQAVRDSSDLFWSVREGLDWSTPARLTTTSGPDSEVTLTRTASGEVFCAWTYLDAEEAAHLMVARWDGAAWSRVTQVTSGDVWTPALMEQAGQPAVCWTQMTEPQPGLNRTALFLSRFQQGSWLPAERFDPAPPPPPARTRGGPVRLAGGSYPFLPSVPGECCECKGYDYCNEGYGSCKVITTFDWDTCTYTTTWGPCVTNAYDPNDIVGPAGYGAARWLPTDTTLAYTIHFENDPEEAIVPAQTVVVRQKLDPNLDFTTFRLGNMGFGTTLVPVAEERAFYQTRVDVVSELGVYVDISAGIDLAAGEVYWEFNSIDPETGEPPWCAFAGFLPPNTDGVMGQAFVRYTIKPKPAIPTASLVNAQARIFFDYNEPMDTPRIFNTLDAEGPVSRVLPLPATVDRPVFTVKWEGVDAADGAGVAGFDIYVSQDNGAWEVWLANTPLTERWFVGERGRNYRFFSLARDHVGHTEARPTQAQATTTVALVGPNEPPRATDDFLGATVSQTVTVAVAKLLANDRDPDGDPLGFALAVERSLYGGTLTLVDASVRYTPPADYVGEDAFYYWVTDGQGGEAIGAVRVEVRPHPTASLNIISITREASGAVVLRLIGLPDLRYTVQFSEDVSLWIDLGRATAQSNGEMQFVDERTPMPVAGYYRLAYP